MHCTALFPVVHLAVLAPYQPPRVSISLRLSGRQKPLEPGPAGSSEQRGGRGCNADGRGGRGFTCRVPSTSQGRLDLLHPRRGAAGGRSECLAEAAERWSHRRDGEGSAAGASVSRGETQHLGAEQLHRAPQAGPAPRSPPLGAGGPRRRPPPASLRAAAAAAPRPAPAAGGDPARGRRPSRKGGNDHTSQPPPRLPAAAGNRSPVACGALRAPASGARLGGASRWAPWRGADSRCGVAPAGDRRGARLSAPSARQSSSRRAPVCRRASRGDFSKCLAVFLFVCLLFSFFVNQKSRMLRFFRSVRGSFRGEKNPDIVVLTVFESCAPFHRD